MPIPFILAGAALLAAGYGVAKGYDAKCDYDEADLRTKEQKIFDEAQQDLNEAREETNSRIEKLGRMKYTAYDEFLSDFVETFGKIKNIDFDNKLYYDLEIEKPSLDDILEIKQEILQIHELAGGATVALGSGAAVGFGAFGAAGMLATASTGTAIASLSGVAATNATLAWFGGGSLAAGGLGMAGGTAILGGIVAGPVIAVAGFMMSEKAAEAKYQAYANYDKARAEVEKMNAAEAIVRHIYNRANEFIDTLSSLEDYFEDSLSDLKDIVAKSNDYRTYSIDEKNTVAICTSLAITIKNVCDAPLLDEDGEVEETSERVLEAANDLISQLEDIS